MDSTIGNIIEFKQDKLFILGNSNNKWFYIRKVNLFIGISFENTLILFNILNTDSNIFKFPEFLNKKDVTIILR